jgi:O-acetyl-ADP-ribose deacetylase (regulator of RNase III)
VIEVRTGNLIAEVKSGVIVQQVNAQGVMGSGIAAVIRAWYPKVWDEYSEIIKPSQVEQVTRAYLGSLIMTEVIEDELWIANVVGQQFYGRHDPQHAPRYTSYDALDEAFTKLAGCLRGTTTPVHFPLLGSDRGGGHWPIVKSIIEHRLRDLPKTLWLLPGVAEPT